MFSGIGNLPRSPEPRVALIRRQTRLPQSIWRTYSESGHRSLEPTGFQLSYSPRYLCCRFVGFPLTSSLWRVEGILRAGHSNRKGKLRNTHRARTSLSLLCFRPILWFGTVGRALRSGKGTALEHLFGQPSDRVRPLPQDRSSSSASRATIWNLFHAMWARGAFVRCLLVVFPTANLP